MDEADLLLGALPAGGHPAGLGGCRSCAATVPLDACEYNVTVFDGRTGNRDEILRHGGRTIRLSHGSLADSGSDTLVHYDGMRVLRDESWELRMFLSRIRERRAGILADYARNCLLFSSFCATRAAEGAAPRGDPFAPCWVKSALVYLANSILALGGHGPSPAHCLGMLRNLKKNGGITGRISTVSDRLGVERATPPLLERMCRSTVGLSDAVEKNGHSAVIRSKHDCLVRNSMLADCYMYLTCVNCANFVSIKDSLHRNPGLIHILRVAFDLENSPERLARDAGLIRKTCGQILSGLSGAAPPETAH